LELPTFGPYLCGYVQNIIYNYIDDRLCPDWCNVVDTKYDEISKRALEVCPKKLSVFHISLDEDDDPYFGRIADSFLACGDCTEQCLKALCLTMYHDRLKELNCTFPKGDALDNFCTWLAYLGRLAQKLDANHRDLKVLKESIWCYVFGDVNRWLFLLVE